jgi:hypothetical protein
MRVGYKPASRRCNRHHSGIPSHKCSEWFTNIYKSPRWLLSSHFRAFHVKKNPSFKGVMPKVLIMQYRFNIDNALRFLKAQFIERSPFMLCNKDWVSSAERLKPLKTKINIHYIYIYIYIYIYTPYKVRTSHRIQHVLIRKTNG